MAALAVDEANDHALRLCGCDRWDEITVASD